VKSLPGEGTDTVKSTSRSRWRPPLENLKHDRSGAVNGTGNAGVNIITCNSGNNVITGLGGADALDGGRARIRLAMPVLPPGVNVSLATGDSPSGGGDCRKATCFVTFEAADGLFLQRHAEVRRQRQYAQRRCRHRHPVLSHATGGVTVICPSLTAQNTCGAGIDTISNSNFWPARITRTFLTGSSGNNTIAVAAACNDS
jgi:Ca2+-binding RTX toxin-like protein